MSLEIVVKTGTKTYNVSCAADAQVSGLKAQLESIVEIPADVQRLIYSGRILKNEPTLESLGVKSGHTLHLVRAQKPPSEEYHPAAASAPAAPPLAAGQGSNNVMSDLTGARYAGLANLPSASMFGPDGGMGPTPNPEEMLALLESPEYAEAMQQMIQDPEAMLSALGPSMPADRADQIRQMLQNPEFRRLLADPQAQRQALRLSQQLRSWGAEGNGAMAGMGGLPGYGQHQTPLGALGALGGLGGFGGLGAGAAAPAPAAPDTRPPEERYESQLQQLNELGFHNFDRNVQALRRSGGHVQGAVEALLDGQV